MKEGTKSRSAHSTLLLVRHAHTDMAGTFCGSINPPLSAEGTAQLARLGDALRAYKVTHIFSSSLLRARETAQSIAKHFGVEVQYLESLHELAFGSWEGLDWDQVMARDPVYAQRWLDRSPTVPAPGGEDFEAFRKRIHQAMVSIADTTGEGCAIVVTHAGVIRTFLADISGAGASTTVRQACDYASFREVRLESGEWRLPQVAASPKADTNALATRKVS